MPAEPIVIILVVIVVSFLIGVAIGDWWANR
jgi:uncharacterized protein YneF (UPF0154 family)